LLLKAKAAFCFHVICLYCYNCNHKFSANSTSGRSKITTIKITNNEVNSRMGKHKLGRMLETGNSADWAM